MANKLGTLIESLIEQHIDNPTHEMRVAFRKLPIAHKWLLYTILEAGDRPSIFSKPEDINKLETRFNVLCPSSSHRSFVAVLEETTEGFVKFVRENGVVVGVTWIHPSCQDLTIEELANSAQDRRRFLSLCTRDGIEKALSVAGGSEGKRMLPLLTSEDDWTCLSARCVALLSESVEIVRLLLRSLSSLKLADPKSRIGAIAKLSTVTAALWSPYLASVRKKPEWSYFSLANFFEMRRIARKMQRPPQLGLFWKETTTIVLSSMEEDRSMEEADIYLKDFYQSACLLAQYEIKLWQTPTIRRLYYKALEGISARAQAELHTSYFYSDLDADALERTSQGWTEVSERFEELRSLPDLDEEFESVFQEAIGHFASQAESLSEKANEKKPKDDGARDVAFEAAVEIEGRTLTLSKLFEDL